MKSLRQTARRALRILSYRPLAMAAPVFLAVALALVALLPAGRGPVPAAHAYEYYDVGDDRVARIAVMGSTTVYPGTNTNIRLNRYNADGDLIELGNVWRHYAGISYEGADDAARAIIDTANGRGASAGPAARQANRPELHHTRLWIPIRADAAPGDYTINISTRSRNYDKEPEATTTMTLTVIGRPASLNARLDRADGVYDPGDRILIRATARDANGALATFTRDPEFGHGVPQICGDCFWRAADRASAAALEIPEGYLTNGTFRARVAANAPPGNYRIAVSHPNSGSEPLAFTVTGDGAVTPEPEPTPAPGPTRAPDLPPGPSAYILSGSNAVPAGGTAFYTVTGTDAEGGLPNLEGTNAEVYVLVDGAGADAITISGIPDPGGVITLNERGAGSFALQVADGTPPATVSLELVGSLDAAPVIRQLNIGTEQVPPPGTPAALGLTAGTGDAAGAVTLRWTAGANSDRHWIAGIKVSDWEAGDFGSIIWTRASSNTMHTVTGLDAGAEYAFTVIAGRSVGDAVEWGSWAPVSRITVPAAPAATP